MQVLPWRTAPTTQQVTPLLCAFDYAAPIKQLILAGKTGKQLDKLHLLAELTAHALKPAITELPEAILPVPLHPSRLRQRGFNQSLELARPLAQQLGLPLLTSEVVRQRNTGEQKKLGAAERQHNLHQAFRVCNPLPYRHIALFDDVVTTGATCAELETLLLDHQVEKIQIWACARTKQ